MPSVTSRAPLLAEAARQIRLFAGVTLVTNIAIGLGVAAGFALFGVPEAWMWGLTAAVLHFVPCAGLAIVMALASLEVYVVQASLGAAVLAAACVALIGITVGPLLVVVTQLAWRRAPAGFSPRCLLPPRSPSAGCRASSG